MKLTAAGWNMEEIKKQYYTVYPKYSRLADALLSTIEGRLLTEDIEVLDVIGRVKEFGKFIEKIESKKYKYPFEEIEDICGIRVICYYSKDLEKVSQIIRTEINVISCTDNTSKLTSDKFGYRDMHLIAKVNESLAKKQGYRGLQNLKAEIQVRTILMDAWDNMSHQLVYKKREHVPGHLERRFNRLSALLETADEQFEILCREKVYFYKSIERETIKSGHFDVNQDLNIDSLQALINYLYPERQETVGDLPDLLDEINKGNIALSDIMIAHEKTRDVFKLFERGVYKTMKIPYSGFTQNGAVRYLLTLTNSDYYKNHKSPAQIMKYIDRWRRKIDGR